MKLQTRDPECVHDRTKGTEGEGKPAPVPQEAHRPPLHLLQDPLREGEIKVI